EVLRAKGRPGVSMLVQIGHIIAIIIVYVLYSNNSFHDLTIIRSLVRIQYILLSLISIKFLTRLSIITMVKNTLKPLVYSCIIVIIIYFGRLISDELIF